MGYTAVFRALGVTDMKQLNDTWQVRAACKGPQSSMFFPPAHFERKDDRERRENAAKAICSSCSVKEACLDFALGIREPHGIWGGLNESERRVILARIAS